MEPATKHCRSCSAPDHEFKDCNNHRSANPYRPLYDRFKPEPYHPSRINNFNRQNNNTSYANAVKNNNTSQQNNRPSPINPNVVDMLKVIQERLDQIDNKLLSISDEIISIKNDLLVTQQNEEDIGFRLNRLEIMHNIEYDENHAKDPKYVFPSHDDFLMSEDISPPIENTQQVLTTNEPNNPHTSTNDSFQRINLVETSVNDIKTELSNLIATIGPIIQSVTITK
jgi:hypothetical protein